MILIRSLRVILFIVLAVMVPLVLLYFYLGSNGKGEKQHLSAEKRNADSVWYFSHRGHFLYHPENSQEGITAAVKDGFNAIELDITESGDGDLVVFHDDNCERLLGINEEVGELSTAELKKYPILVNDGEVSSSHVLTLEEVFQSKGNRMVFYLDMKISSFCVANKLSKLIEKYKAENSVIVASSDIVFVFYIEENHPEIITAHEGFDAGKEWTWMLMPEELKPDYLSGYLRETDEDHLQWLKDNDLLDRRIVYGVDTTNLEKALASGYKNIILDYDSVMDETLGLRGR